jgi:hypothetical protein
MEQKCRIICKDISSEPSDISGFSNYAIALSCVTCGLAESVSVNDQISEKLALESAKFIMSDYYCPVSNPVDTNNE